MSQKAQLLKEFANSLEDKKENIIEKYKELDAKCDSIIEKIAKKKKKEESE